MYSFFIINFIIIKKKKNKRKTIIMFSNEWIMAQINPAHIDLHKNPQIQLHLNDLLPNSLKAWFGSKYIYIYIFYFIIFLIFKKYIYVCMLAHAIFFCFNLTFQIMSFKKKKFISCSLICIRKWYLWPNYFTCHSQNPMR